MRNSFTLDPRPTPASNLFHVRLILIACRMQPVFMRNLEPINRGRLASANADKQIERLQQAVETVIKGKPEAIRLAIVTLIAGGHLLVEDVSGVGKPTLAHAIARATAINYL